MSDSKKGFLFTLILGVLLLTASVLALCFGLTRTHYTAEITEITRTYTTRKTLNGHSERRYNEDVTVTYTGKDGAQKTAEKVRIKRSVESMLPKVGDTIEVKEGLRVSEYSATTPLAVFIAFQIAGIALVISSLRVRRKAKRAGLYE